MLPNLVAYQANYSIRVDRFMQGTQQLVKAEPIILEAEVLKEMK